LVWPSLVVCFVSLLASLVSTNQMWIQLALATGVFALCMLGIVTALVWYAYGLPSVRHIRHPKSPSTKE
jgi:hypothetical protein